jgi:AcrR family transcriptional regulator
MNPRTSPGPGAGATALALLQRALDPAAAPPSDAVSERILDAALALAAASGISNLTMEQVARRAGLSRMTVYRRFGDRERLLQQLAVRECRRCLAELDASSAPDAPIEEQIAEGLVTSLRLAREHPLLGRLARVEPGAALQTLTADHGALLSLARQGLSTRLRASQRAGMLGELEVDEAAELLVRIAVSFVLLPDSVLPLDDDEQVRELARRTIAPMLAPSNAPQRPSG